MRATLLSLLIISVSILPVSAYAQDEAPVAGAGMREFVLSCSYGVLAGTLVGAATLAFSDKPGDNLNKIARGASLGLYAGIALGLFVIYGGGVSEEDEEQLVKNFEPPRLIVAPIIEERGLSGAAAQFTVVQF